VTGKTDAWSFEVFVQPSAHCEVRLRTVDREGMSVFISTVYTWTKWQNTNTFINYIIYCHVFQTLLRNENALWRSELLTIGGIVPHTSLAKVPIFSPGFLSINCTKVRQSYTCALNKHQAMKAYWGSRCIAPRILDLGTRWRWVASFMPRPLYPQGMSPWYPLDRRVGRPQSQSWRGGEENNSKPLPGLEPRSSSP
jgi:hypothetical protein